MGFQHAAILAPVSFFLGVLFICFNIDHQVLWGTLTQEVVGDGFHLYRTFFNAPPAIKALLHSLIFIGLCGFVFKLHKWDDSAMFFDGTSLVCYVFGVVVYLTVTIPGLRTIVMAASEVEDEQVQVEALQVLSAGNIIIIGCLGLVLALQAGQEYALRMEARAKAKVEKVE
ncbi:hypothetical protein FA15DRAFT_603276 [Coprinopsis marcescibilis]|uniref:Shr3 amino acid permease chaperone n=1 Tax=Coprinopsis marcescibilis TaxID=230819 RepID=A0A5C3KEZ1_COPMA|nr:hypothetical protein FA15DRAFT_603276 [Coprinopsis marcescibilis]